MINAFPCDAADLASVLFADAEDALILFDLRSGRILDANDAAQRLMGCPRSCLEDKPIAGVFVEPTPLRDLHSEARSWANAQVCGADNRVVAVRWSVRHIGAGSTVGLLMLRAAEPDDMASALREVQQRFDVFMNSLPLLAFAKDADGRMMYVNQAFTAKFGLPAEHFVGKSDAELWPADIAERVRELDVKVIAGAQPVEVRERVPTPDGVLREWWVAKFPFHDSKGRVMLGGIALDLTERIQIEEALRRSEERYRQLWQRNLAGIVRATFTGRILDCNDSFASMFGYESRAAILTRSTKELYFDPGVRAEFLSRLRENQLLTNYEMCMRRADGTPIWVLENASLVIEDGEEILEGTLIDITDRKRIEEALRASEANYRTLVSHLDQAIFLKDRDLRYVMANAVFCAGAGRTEDELRGKTISEVFGSNVQLEKSHALEKVVLEEARVIETEEVLQLAAGLRHIRVHRTPVKDPDGTVVGVLGICWDVTKQRSLEAQLRHVHKMDAIGQLAGGIAHDFNNLLTIMLGNVSCVLAGNHDLNTTLELVRNVEKAGLRAAELTKTLLGFSRSASLATVPCGLNDAIDEVIRLTRSTLPANIHVEVCAERNLWQVEADPGQLNQVLTNLTLNARDAMPMGGIIRYETSPFEPDAAYLAEHVEGRAGQFVRLRVHDTGPGIPAEFRQHIFEPFFTTKPRGKGSGLGLAIVFSIVKQHRGWIVCNSMPAEGTTFEILLPRCAAGREHADASVPASLNGRGTVLVVDDEALIRQFSKEVLTRAGYEVMLAEDGQVAVELYEQHHERIALVILDAIMPRLSGREALRDLVERFPRVNVLFSSGYSTEPMSLAEFPQVRGILPKPYRAEQLMDAVAAIVGRASEN